MHRTVQYAPARGAQVKIAVFWYVQYKNGSGYPHMSL
jgi:hypothetical protein